MTARRVHLEVPLAGASAQPAAVGTLARAAEAAGFAGIAFTDHPAPPRRWLESGGHPTYDPFAALAFCAGLTSSVRLVTYLAVAPYRNPLLLARSVATVDRLSGGRLTLAVGSGYLRGEFEALGRPFDRRGALLDEALAVLGSAFGDAVTADGDGWTARQVVVEPGPVQLPCPPVWIGGNGPRSRDRAVRLGAAWAPMVTTARVAETARTPAIETVDDLRAAVVDLRRRARAAGRHPDEVGVAVALATGLEEALADTDGHRRHLDELAAAGATDLVVRFAGVVADPTDAAAAYADAFIGPHAP